MDPGSIGAIVLACIMAVLLIIVGLSMLTSEQKASIQSLALKAVSTAPSDSSTHNWMYIMPVFFNCWVVQSEIWAI